MKAQELKKLIREEISKALGEGKDSEIWKKLNQDDFEGQLENWESFIVISYDSISGIKLDLFKILDWIKTDEETLNSKYPNIKHKINLGNRYGELPFIEIDN